MIIDDLESDKPSVYYRYRIGTELIERVVTTFPYYWSLEHTNFGTMPSIDGSNVYKKYYPKSHLRHYFKKSQSRSYEVDVSLENIYLKDNFITLPEYNPLVMHLDIETNRGLDAVKADKAITAITFWDSYSEKYKTLSWKGGLSDSDLKVIYDKFINDEHSLIIFETEKEMMKNFVYQIQTINPDIITGWNVIKYDIKYIINRLYRLGIDPSALSPVHQIDSELKYNSHTPIKGRICFDLLFGYQKVKDGSIGENTLRAVLEDNNAPIKKLYGMDDYDSDYLGFLEYSVRDVEGTVWIDDRFDIISMFMERQRLAGCKFSDTYYNKDMVDMAHIKKAKELGFVLPTGTYHEKVPYKGATVIEPEIGLHKNVIILDYKSLYPSSMEACNMSYETKSKNGDIKLGNGVSFNSSPPGLTTSLLGDIQEKREYYIEKRDNYPEKTPDWNRWDNKQRTTKFLKNSFYGWMAYAGSRLYDPDIAASITWLSRQALAHSIAHINEYYPSFKIIYGHTDSLFIHVPWDINYDELMEIAKELEQSINDSMYKFDEKYNLIPNKFKIELERCMETFLLVGKNRYAGKYPIDGDYSYKIQGFEAKKKLTTPIVKELQKDTLVNLLNFVDKDVIFSDVLTIVQGIRNNTFPIEDICIHKKINKSLKSYKKPGDAVKAALWANEYLDTDFVGGGDVIKMVIVMYDAFAESLNVQDDCVVGFKEFEQIKDFTLDVDEMIEKLIPGKLTNIFIAMGWDLMPLLTSKRIKGANKW